MEATLTATTSPAKELAEGYDVATMNSRNRRRAASGVLQSADRQLPHADRNKAISATRDVRANFAVAAWMVRKHLDFVAEHRFQAKTGDRALDKDIESEMERASRPRNFDAAGRFSREQFIRQMEARRTEDGDAGMMKIRNGTVSGIEGDRIRNSTGTTHDGDTVLGIKTTRGGRHLSYQLHNRIRGGSFQFDREVRANRMIWHGFYERFDQVRGISPITAGVNQLKDVYENFDYALAKAKVHQLFALVFSRDGEGTLAPTTATADADGDGTNESDYEVDFSDGPISLDLNKGDSAEMLSSNQPSNEFQAFTELVTAVVLKALDIPFSFFNESFTNFFGSRASWILYNRSCLAKRRDVVEMLHEWTRWRFQLWIQDGQLTLPRGMNLDSIIWEYTPVGMPWWDPTKEVQGERDAVAAGFSDPYTVCKSRDSDFETNIDQTTKAIDYARKKGFALSYDAAGLEQLAAINQAATTEDVADLAVAAGMEEKTE